MKNNDVIEMNDTDRHNCLNCQYHKFKEDNGKYGCYCYRIEDFICTEREDAEYSFCDCWIKSQH